MEGTSGQALAESIVLRGARQQGAPLQAAQAGDLLDQSLILEGEVLHLHKASLGGYTMRRLTDAIAVPQVHG